MAKLTGEAEQGVQFLTTAGGVRHSIRRERDYLASIKSVHHFTLFDFDGDQVTITAIDIRARPSIATFCEKSPTPLRSFVPTRWKSFVTSSAAR